jgi:protein SCO1/2
MKVLAGLHGRRAGVLMALAAGMLLAGCKSAGFGAPPAEKTSGAKVYHLRGKIVATDVGSGAVTVDGQAMPGFMEAMTMPYKLAQPNVLSELHPGDMITAHVLVDETPDGPENARLDEIVVVGQARVDTRPTVNYHVPSEGDAVPNFALLNQSDRTIHLDQFRGKVLLLTFIYTRCPLADYCPRMSANFSEIDHALEKEPAVYAKTHLLSVSFDPKYDTPQVLRSYGGAHTGKFTEEDFKHWDFAAPSMEELPKMEEWFDLGVTGMANGAGNPQTIQHSLSTVVIGKDGRMIAWYPTNDWKPAEVLKVVEKAAG